MTKPIAPPANAGQPSLDRRSLVRGLGTAALASPIAVTSAWPAAAASPLHGLIGAHRTAFAAFHDAIDRENELEEAYELAFPPKQRPIVPSLLGGGYQMWEWDGLDGCKEHIAIGYQRERERLASLSRIAPELAEQVHASLDAKEAENMALADRYFAEEQDRQESFGFAAATRALDEASDAENDALIAVCAYPCKTIEEARIKAEYIASTHYLNDGLEDEHVEALVRSFLEAPAAVEQEG